MLLHHTELGAGPPLVVLHGLLGSHQNLLPVCRPLAAQFRVFAVDLRNHGRSPHRDVMDYAAMAEDVDRFLQTHDLAAAHVLGHSMGGKTAMQLALHHPQRVDRLIVADMSPRAAGPRFAKLLQTLRALPVAEFRSRHAADAALAPAVPDEAVRQFLLKNLVPDGRGGHRWRAHLEGIAANYDRLREAVDSAIPFTGPALFIRGGRSDYIGAEDELEIHRLFPAAEIRTLPDAGHWVHVDAPAAFAAAVREFLTR